MFGYKSHAVVVLPCFHSPSLRTRLLKKDRFEVEGGVLAKAVALHSVCHHYPPITCSWYQPYMRPCVQKMEVPR